jgi:hypothetical protein
MVDREGTGKALASLKMIALNNGAKIDCHQIAHAIGEESYKKFGEDALNNKSESCSGGYLHGVSDAAASKLKPSEYSSFYSKYCASDKSFYFAVSCTHGVGHTLFKNKVNNIESDKICNVIADNIKVGITLPSDPIVLSTVDLPGNCVDGYIMEKFSFSNRANGLNYQDVCVGFTNNNFYYCAFELIRAQGISNSEDNLVKLNNFKELCNSLADSYIRSACGFYVGENIEDTTSKSDLEAMKGNFYSICKGEEFYLKGCIQGFSTKTFFYNIPLDFKTICDGLSGEIAYCRSSYANLHK